MPDIQPARSTSGRASCRRVCEHVPLGGVADAIRSSSRVLVSAIVCACTCARIGTGLAVRHLVRHDTLQDGRIVDPRALLGPDGGDGLRLPQLEHLPPAGPWCRGSLRVPFSSCSRPIRSPSVATRVARMRTASAAQLLQLPEQQIDQSRRFPGAEGLEKFGKCRIPIFYPFTVRLFLVFSTGRRMFEPGL